MCLYGLTQKAPPKKTHPHNKCTFISSLDDLITVSDYYDSFAHNRNGLLPFHPTLDLW